MTRSQNFMLSPHSLILLLRHTWQNKNMLFDQKFNQTSVKKSKNQHFKCFKNQFCSTFDAICHKLSAKLFDCTNNKTSPSR